MLDILGRPDQTGGIRTSMYLVLYFVLLPFSISRMFLMDSFFFHLSGKIGVMKKIPYYPGGNIFGASNSSREIEAS